MKKISLLLLILILGACSTGPEVKKEPAQRATERETREFKDAENAYKTKKIATALKKFATFVQRHPKTDLTDRAAYYVAQIYYEQGDYFRATKYWLYITDGLIISPLYDKSLYGAALAQFQMGRFDDSQKTLDRFHATSATDPELNARFEELKGKVSLQKGDTLTAVEDFLKAGNLKTLDSEKQRLSQKSMEQVSTHFTQNQLEEALGKSEFQPFELTIRYRLGQIYYDQRSWGQAKEQFSAIVSRFPGSEQARSAQTYMSSMDAQEITDSTVVGVILPLSGKYAATGYKTLRGIQLGMGFFNKSSSTPVKLAIIDSEGNADIARRGVERLVSEDHVVVIIGDILSKTASAIATKAQELGVPCLSLAQRQDLSNVGEFIFRNTLTPEMQMNFLVELAMKEKSFKRFAILFPNDSYGTEYASLFWDAVLSRGGEVTAAQSYQSEETDFREAIQRLVGIYYAEEDRGKELQMRTLAWQKDQVQNNVPKSQRDKPPKDLLPPVIDFDAIFIADGPKAVGQIAPMLAYNDINNIPLLGTNLWDTPQIVARGNKFVEGSIFVDNYFSEDQSPTLKRFVSEFQNQFSTVPDVFEAQGFDSALLISQVLRDGNFSLSRGLLKDRLAQGSTNTGSTGPLRMTPQREVGKSLVPLTVQGGKIVKFETGTSALQ